MKFITLATYPAALLGLLMLGACQINLMPPSSARLQETVLVDAKSAFTRNKILMVPIDGMMTDFEVGSLLYRQTNTVSEVRRRLDAATDDGYIKGLILRINSPGGTVTASDLIYRAVSEFKKRYREERGTDCPVVAVFTDIGASGGYYAALSADQIIASPTALTGSIGVIFETYNVEGLLSLLGVKPVIFASGEKKDILSPYRRMEDSEKEILRDIVKENRVSFLKIVRERRGGQLEPALREKLDQYLASTETEYLKQDKPGDPLTDTVLDSRILTATQAKTAGLVDQVGYLDDAITFICSKKEIRDARVIVYDRAYTQTVDLYAATDVPTPGASSAQSAFSPFLPFLRELALSARPGFYYLWKPGLGN